MVENIPNTMIIGVDGNEANVEMKVGVSFYTYNLIQYFRKIASKNLRFKIFLRKEPGPDMPYENSNFSYTIVRGRPLWTQLFLPLHLNVFRNIDVFFSPAHFVPRFCPVPVVVTIHDLSYHYYPDDFLSKDLFTLRHWTRYAVQKAAKIIAVSRTTKKDIMNVYHAPETKIEVVYNGFEKDFPQRKKYPKLSTFNIERRSILYVGTLQPRKNITTLIRAFSFFRERYPEFELVIAGKKGWMYNKIYEEVSELGLDNDVFFTDYITDYQLGFLYKNAFCFVLPSFYEGFGIPILEAMGYGCPVISSNTPSLNEIGNDACLYFDPNNTDDLLQKLVELKENEKLRKELVLKGKKRVKLFSWKTCAKQTLDIIESVQKR